MGPSTFIRGSELWAPVLTVVHNDDIVILNYNGLMRILNGGPMLGDYRIYFGPCTCKA